VHYLHVFPFQIFDSTLCVKRYSALVSQSHIISPIINEQPQISISLAAALHESVPNILFNFVCEEIWCISLSFSHYIPSN
jgi:hypothetical protein